MNQSDESSQSRLVFGLLVNDDSHVHLAHTKVWVVSQLEHSFLRSVFPFFSISLFWRTFICELGSDLFSSFRWFFEMLLRIHIFQFFLLFSAQTVIFLEVRYYASLLHSTFLKLKILETYLHKKVVRALVFWIFKVCISTVFLSFKSEKINE